QLELHAPFGEAAQPQLRSLKVGQHADRASDLRLRTAHRGDGRGVVVVASMAEIDPEEVRAGPRQLDHFLGVSAGRTKSRDDAGAASADHGPLQGGLTRVRRMDAMSAPRNPDRSATANV